MKIDMRFNCSELAGKLRDGAYDAAAGATVTELVDAALAEAGEEITEELRESLIFLFNSSPVFRDTALSEDGMLRVMFKVLGG